MTFRILHVLDHSLPLQSGYSFRTAALLREQRGFGWTTFHLTSPKHYAPSPDEEVVAGLPYFRTNVQPTFMRRAPVLDNAMVVRDTRRRIEALLPALKPDVIHAHSPCLNGLAALGAARKHGIPLVYEMRASWEDAAVDHGSTRAGSLRYRLSRGLETFVVQRADAIVAICEGLASDIAVRGVPRERITIVRNAVNIADFDFIDRPNAALQQDLQLGSGPILGFIGSLYGYEGIGVLIEALPAILEGLPGARVMLVGGGPAEAELRALAARFGVADRVHFLGRVPHERVRDYYSIIDLLVYPRKSTRLTELVTPLKPLEAMSLGRYFIASDVGGHRELIPEFIHGNLFRADDPADLARAALRVMASRSEWPALLRKAREHVSNQCTWTLSAARYRDVYAGVVGRRALDP
jgi:PEP-CTERM/exosortase A-associated glycosyltransferase